MKNVKYFLLMALFLMMPAQKVHAQLNFGSVLSVVKAVKKAMKEKNSTQEQSQPVVNGDAASSAPGSGQSTSVLPAKTSNDEVTLVVSADGATKDEATKTALRSAIEQAYGTFVSANTTILNDELVKDEIVTITSGNIKNYYEIASATMPNGKQTVTLKATVCVSKLVSYAQSKGASTEFAGAAFGMDMKLKELNKKNEMIALENLLIQVKELLPNAYDRVLLIEEPKQGNLCKKIDYDDYDCEHYLSSTIESYSRMVATDDKGKLNESLRIAASNHLRNIPNCYEVTMNVVYQHNANTDAFYEFIGNTLSTIALSRNEIEELTRKNIPISAEVDFRGPGIGYKSLRFRNSNKDISIWSKKLREAFFYEFSNFQIVDNLGTKSFFDMYYLYVDYQKKGDCYFEDYNVKRKLYLGKINGRRELDNLHITDGSGIFFPVILCNFYGLGGNVYRGERDSIRLYMIDDNEPISIGITLYIPKDKISQYTNFTIEPKE